MIKFSKNLFLMGVLAAVISQGAMAGVKLRLAGAIDMSNLAISGGTSSVTFDSKMGFGGGLLLGIPMGHMFEFELGGLYVQRKISLSGTDTTFPSVQLPVGIRVWPIKFLALEAGGFAQSSAGNVTDANGNTGTISDAGLLNLNYGVYGGAGIDIPLGATAGIFADGRYLLGLANLNPDSATSSTVSIKQSDIQILVGVRIGGGMSK